MGADPQALAALKAQLQQTLASLEQQQKAAEARMRPQTLEEAQDLESKMVDALDELRRQKGELEKGPEEQRSEQQS